ncbi:XdhC family protein [Paenibacillus protaetiae]|uniref:XdhC/CoxI family protein n=1 Tax=Paenibacillus protaetiae TaxID=2509456 RepID=A0A4P6EUD0_9BACL|nr:XdhC/CoxI family protein [Paenibacillus protaetiae]QAY65713.1 XdhC/CoxI family protein [Paenibacillus protaetiae]
MDMHRLLQELERTSQPGVLATIIGVAGHAYRKQGSAMLLLADGSKRGSISPGCLENDLQARVPELLDAGLPYKIRYNMQPEEDAVWGETVGCGGVIDILLEPLQEPLPVLLKDAKQRLDCGDIVRLSRTIGEAGIRYRLSSLPADGTPMAAVYAERKAEQSLQPHGGENLLQGEGEEEPAMSLDHSSAVAETETVVTLDWRPQPRLIMFGAGDDAIPVHRLAALSGFRVTVVDWRPSLVTEERFPDAERITAGLYTDAAVIIKPSDFVLICSHQLERDRLFIQTALEAGVSYIGVVGSRKRIAMLFGDGKLPSAVHAPVGLPIGADGPSEIAVSIAAELISVYRASQAAWRKEANGREIVRHLFGGRSKPEDGEAEAELGAGGRRDAGQFGASCSLG